MNARDKKEDQKLQINDRAISLTEMKNLGKFSNNFQEFHYKEVIRHRP